MEYGMTNNTGAACGLSTGPRRIVITVSPTADVRVDAQGFRGQGCQALTSALGAALGIETAATVKPEFYEEIPAQPAVVQQTL